MFLTLHLEQVCELVQEDASVEIMNFGVYTRSYLDVFNFFEIS